MRRLRSALSLFRPAVEDVEFRHLRHELRWFTSRLGHARNLDVYLERDVDEQERAELIGRRELAYDDVADAMNSPKFRRLLVDLVGWSAIGSWRAGRPASRPIESFANRRLDRLWDSVAGAGRNISRLDEESRHQLRIQGKKLRYAVEFLHGLYPHAKEEEKKFAHAVENLQESLGKLNDMATARTLVESAASEEPWLIGSLDERRHLVGAEDAMRSLMRVGAFWRTHEEFEPA
jgi:CHAD domain-containing protein